MSDETLVDRARRLCEAATSGPWQVYGDDGADVCDSDLLKLVCRVTRAPVEANAAFIAASRTLIPQLLSRIEELEAERDEVRAKLKHTLDVNLALIMDRDQAREAAIARAESAERERDEERNLVAGCRDTYERVATERDSLRSECSRLKAELAEARRFLDAPLSTLEPEPTAVDDEMHPHVRWEVRPGEVWTLDPCEAVEIGAALIRAAKKHGAYQ